MLVVDVNGLAYLQSLESLDAFPAVLRVTGVAHVPWKVYLQLKRSGRLADVVDGWIAQGFVAQPVPAKRNGPVGKRIQELLRTDVSKWVSRDIADLECAALALVLGATASVQLFTAERGLTRMCEHLRIGTVDVFDVVALIAHVEGWSQDRVNGHLAGWQRKDAGNGKPQDYCGSFEPTFVARYGAEGALTLTTRFGLTG